jgi:hypothetical protein
LIETLHSFYLVVSTDAVSVVDWDWTFEAPIPAVIQFPWFMADIPGWHNDGTIAGDDFEEERCFLTQALRSKEQSTFGNNFLSNLLVDARERQRFQSAINHRDVHLDYIKSDKRFQEAKLKDLRPTLEVFLVKHPQFQQWVSGFQQGISFRDLQSSL